MKNVLIINHSNVYKAFFQKLLKNQFHLFFCDSYHSSLEILNKNSIHLILIEEMIQNEPGTVLSGRIKNIPEYANIPIIITTSNQEQKLIPNNVATSHIEAFLDKEELEARLLPLIHILIQKEEKEEYGKILIFGPHKDPSLEKLEVQLENLNIYTHKSNTLKELNDRLKEESWNALLLCIQKEATKDQLLQLNKLVSPFYIPTFLLLEEDRLTSILPSWDIKVVDRYIQPIGDFDLAYIIHKTITNYRNLMNKKILIADDSPVVQMTIKNALQCRGFETFSVLHYEEILPAIQQSAFDCVLLDIVFEKAEGFEVCQQIKKYAQEKGIHLPVIMMTSLQEKENVLRGFRSGADDYLIKPMETDELIARIELHLNLKGYMDALKAANQQLNDMNRLKNDFYRIVTHNLRSPLNSIIGFTGLLLQPSNSYQLNEDAKEVVEHIKNAGKFQLNLINQLVTVMQLDENRVQIKIKVLNIIELIEQNKEMISPQASAKSIEIAVHSNQDHFIKGDETILNQVINNLLTNAVKFSQPNGIIDVFVNERPSHLEIAVKDNGLGIPKENQDKVFEKFTSFRRTGTAGESSTGLGLSICKALIEQHKGQIWLESEGEGKGTTFFFTIPKQL